MLELVVDSIVFADSESDPGTVESDKHVARLVRLVELLNSGSLRVVVPASTWAALEESGLAPPWYEAYGTGADRDVISLKLRLLNRATNLEDWLGIDDILIRDARAQPDGHLAGRPEPIVEDYHRTCGMIVGAQSLCGCAAPSPVILTTQLVDGPQIRICGRVDILIPDNDDAAPFLYNGELTHIEMVNSIVRAVEPTALWKNGEYRAAIALEIVRTTGGSSIDWLEGDFHFTVRDEFVESLQNTGFDREETLISRAVRECANIVVERDQRDTRHLRIAESGGAPPRRRESDGAIAWRRDIDAEYRIHYWQRGERFELARLASHNDFGIPE